MKIPVAAFDLAIWPAIIDLPFGLFVSRMLCGHRDSRFSAVSRPYVDGLRLKANAELNGVEIGASFSCAVCESIGRLP